MGVHMVVVVANFDESSPEKNRPNLCKIILLLFECSVGKKGVS